MLALFTSTILLLDEAGGSNGGFMQFYDTYLNIPGFEVWKFINLAIFIGALIYLLKKPLSDQFKARRDLIRADLIKAENDKKAALARLSEVEGHLAQMGNEKETILAKAKEESEDERKRLTEQTKHDISRLRDQADAEIARIANQTRAELRRFSAEESIRLAEQKLRSQIGSDIDSKLVRASIQEIGGLN
jgi:F0F1-type ATP synthase membrane subunit b/b'